MMAGIRANALETQAVQSVDKAHPVYGRKPIQTETAIL
jgi:hypothetical protein